MTRPNRRSFLQTSAAVVSSFSVAGCSGGNGEGERSPTPSPTSTPPPSLEVAELGFAAEEPTEHGTYAEQPDATYGFDEVVWLYFDVNGVTGESGGSGEVTIDLQEDLTVEGPEGSTVFDKQFSFDREFPESRLDSFFIVNDLTMPRSGVSGTYTVDAEFTDRVSGQSTTISGEFSVERPVGSAPGSFNVGDFAFCAAEPTGYDEFVPQPDAAYPQGKMMWIYITVPGVSYTLQDDKKVLDLEATISVKGSGGTTVAEKTYTEDSEFPGDADLSTYFIQFWHKTTNFDVGNHTVEITLTDNVAGETASATQSFTIADPIQQAEGPFEIPDIVYCATEPRGYRDYTEQPDATYTPGDDVWFYFEIPGISYRWEDDVKVLHLTGMETITGPDGGTVYEQPIDNREEAEPGTDLSTYFLYDAVTTSTGVDAGSYSLELSITDELAGQTVTRTESFSIE